MGRTRRTTLTPNQLRFCSEYAADRNATQAYLRAYPGKAYTTARNEACKLLALPDIKAEVDAAEKEHARRTGVSARRVLRELAGIAFLDVADAFEGNGLPAPRPLSKIAPATRRSIQSVRVKRKKEGRKAVVEEVEYKFADKLSALDKLCKHLGITRDGAALEELIHALRQDAAIGPAAVSPASPESGNPPDSGGVEGGDDTGGAERGGEVQG
jgi:phage terminase small subunit